MNPKPDPCFVLQEHNGHVVVDFTTDALVNPLDLERIGRRLYQVADEQIAPAAGERRLVLDCQKIRAFSSQAVGILLLLSKKLGRGRILTVCCPGSQLTQVLRITRLDQMLTITPTREQALG